jgi:hypothetical protein
MADLSPVTLLDSRHDRAGFDCGVEPLNLYLKQYATKSTVSFPR